MKKSTEIRVLVVDDEASIATTLRDILSRCGYEVDVAYSGEEAVERVTHHRPDCILMDIRMPGINGVDAFRQIKQRAPNSFVIFMTGYCSSDLVQEALKEGAIEVLPKPLDMERLLRMIDEMVATTPVLVADADTLFCASLSEALVARGFDVRLSHTLDDAIRLFESQPGRVVILDMEFDNRTGLNALLILKEINPAAIVILMTGCEDLRDDLHRGLKMSAYACLFKPFDIDDLVSTIREGTRIAEEGAGSGYGA